MTPRASGPYREPDTDYDSSDSTVDAADQHRAGTAPAARRATAPRDPPEKTIRVLIVSDVRLYREGLSDLLGRRARIQVVGMAGDADEGIRQIRELQPDAALLDLGGGNVADARYFLEAAPSTRLIALAAPESDEDVIALAEAGVLGYVTRDQSLDELVSTIAGVAHGEMVCSPRIATVLVRRVQALAADRPRPTDRLTAREAEVLELVAQGLANKEIATRLFIEVTTVKNHIHNILDKLGVSRREEAVAHMRMSLPHDSSPPIRGARGVRAPSGLTSDQTD